MTPPMASMALMMARMLSRKATSSSVFSPTLNSAMLARNCGGDTGSMALGS
jgi:hypothetical protein